MKFLLSIALTASLLGACVTKSVTQHASKPARVWEEDGWAVNPPLGNNILDSCNRGRLP